VLTQIDAVLTGIQERRPILTRVYEARGELAEIVPDVIGPAWPAYLAAVLQGLDSTVIRRICGRLALSPRVIHELIDSMSLVDGACSLLHRAGERRPSEIAAALRLLPGDVLPLLLACCPEQEPQQVIRHYLTTWRHIRPCLSGDDVKRLGGQQGPEIGRLLARLQAAKLDGEAPTREAEETLVRTALSVAP
jgi:tRNA nucleotidyltransferase (CCA-adding enzyme)